MNDSVLQYLRAYSYDTHSFGETFIKMVIPEGIEPTSSAWKADIITIILMKHGGPRKIRTCDPLVNSQALCR